MVEADVTAPDVLADLVGRVDVVLCNPPYVPDEVAVPPEVERHDPANAVFGGADGLAVIRPVVARAAELLRPGGVLGVEHDDTHGVVVPALLAADGRFAGVTGHRGPGRAAPVRHRVPPCRPPARRPRPGVADWLPVMLYDCRSPAERDRGIAAAIEAVKNGELVVLPTDTVYGIGADAFTPYAVKALLDAKGGRRLRRRC